MRAKQQAADKDRITARGRRVIHELATRTCRLIKPLIGASASQADVQKSFTSGLHHREKCFAK
jgi:hypothetical protein